METGFGVLNIVFLFQVAILFCSLEAFRMFDSYSSCDQGLNSLAFERE